MDKNNEDENLSDILNEIISDEDELYKLLNEFYSYNNIDTKTEIPKQKLYTILRVIYFAYALKDYDAKESENIEKMVQIYERLMISANRKGRKELFDTLKASSSDKEGKGLFSFLRKKEIP